MQSVVDFIWNDPYNILEIFLCLVHLLFLVVKLATAVSSLVDEGTVG